MKTISADYNAMTEAGHVRLTLPCSQDDILRLGLRPGDWAWLSDTEVMVGAQLAIDDRYGLVGVPDWDTLVHLDDEGADDSLRITAELHPLLTKEPPSSDDEPRILELLTQLEHAPPPRFNDSSPEFLAFRRALALRQMDKLGLALLEMNDARRVRPHDPTLAFVYLDILRLEDLPSAVSEAHKFAELPDVRALVLSACINILATWAEHASDDQFDLDHPARFSPGGRRSGSRPKISMPMKRGRRSWRCLTSIEGLSSFERAESPWLNRRSKTPNKIIRWARYSTKSPGSRPMTGTLEKSQSACEQPSRSNLRRRRSRPGVRHLCIQGDDVSREARHPCSQRSRGDQRSLSRRELGRPT